MIRMKTLAFALTGLVVTALPALAETCGMAMPASALRTVGRGYARHHGGIDLMAPYGSPIQAAATGTVAYAARYFAYGLIVDIRHDDGSITRYAHMSRFAPGIVPGVRVQRGQQIGFVGTSGNAHGAHVHFEVRIAGRPVDPRPYLEARACPGGAAPVLEAQIVQFPTAPVATVTATPEPERFIDARPGGLLE